MKRAGAATGFGQAVYILGDDGAVTVYGHVNRYFVSAGERVVTVIAASGFLLLETFGGALPEPVEIDLIAVTPQGAAPFVAANAVVAFKKVSWISVSEARYWSPASVASFT